MDNPTGGTGRAWDRTSPLYGWTGGGGSTADGRNVLFLYGGGCGFKVIHRFTDLKGGYDPVGLTVAPDSALYGAIAVGPDVHTNTGGVFRITFTSDGCGVASYQIIYRFTDGHQPTGGMIFGPDGALYLAANGGGSEILKLKQSATNADHWTPSLVYSESTHGFAGHMAFGTDGALYLVDTGNGDTVPGTVYRLRKQHKDGTITWVPDTLYSFAAEDKEGNNPSGVVFGPDGVLYGTTKDNVAGGYGTVFKVTPQPDNPSALPWNMTVLHPFAGTDGSRPTGTLAFGSNGSIYGTTVFGAPGYPTNYQNGYAYELVP
jgi:hypothetical protein